MSGSARGVAALLPPPVHFVTVFQDLTALLPLVHLLQVCLASDTHLSRHFRTPQQSVSVCRTEKRSQNDAGTCHPPPIRQSPVSRI